MAQVQSYTGPGANLIGLTGPGQDYVVQNVDPRGDCEGGPGFTVRDKLSQRSYLRGVVGLALDWGVIGIWVSLNLLMVTRLAPLWRRFEGRRWLVLGAPA